MNDPCTPAEAAERFEALRPRLISVAYGLLGTVAEAEDVVQDAWLRLQRTLAATTREAPAGTHPDEPTAPIEDLTGWLVTTTARLALDVLRSARHRRETYIGPWLPEPVETAPGAGLGAAFGTGSAADPADAISLADSLSWAMLVVLETLSPAERTAFVLHDVFGLTFDQVAHALGRTPAACRKLASRAREHIGDRKPRFDVDPAQHRDTVEAFARATRVGDLDALLALLDPDAVLTSDGGGRVSAARKPIQGAERIARFLIGVNAKHPDQTKKLIHVNGGLAVLMLVDDAIASVTALGIQDGRIRTLDMIRNPEKFHGLRTTRGH